MTRCMTEHPVCFLAWLRPSTNSKRRERKKIQNSVCILPYSGAVLLCTAEH